jgi:hypothetical protein
MADTDEELFEQAFSEAEPKPEGTSEAPAEEPTEPEPEGEQPRDEHGRFAPKAKEPEEPAEEQPSEPEPEAKAEPAKEPPPQQEHRVPLAEHLSEREKRQAAERERDEERRQRESDRRELQALQRQIEELKKPKTEPPDFYADPQAFVRSQLDPVQQTVQQQQEAMIDRFSRMMAVQQHGKDTVDAAYKALEDQVQANPAARFEAQRIWQSEHPYGELISWHKRQTALSEIGEDPAAYRQRLREELLKDPSFQAEVIAATKAAAQSPAAGQPRPQTTTRLPPSLNRATGQGGPAVTTEPQSESELFAEMFSR